jgi:hypothetical protein
MVDDLAERALGDAIAEKSVLVTYFDVVAVDLNLRQTRAAMDGQCGRSCLIGHD